jgi:hypothetical protein
VTLHATEELVSTTTPGAVDGPASDPGPPEEGTGATGTGSGGRVAAFYRRRRSAVAWTVYIIALAVYIVVEGIPYATDILLVWVTAALFVACLSDMSRWRRGFIRDWLPLYAVLAVYALLRGFAGHPWFAPHWSPQLRFDEWLGLGVAPTVRLQQAFFDAEHPHVWDYAAWLTYMSHFFVSYIIAAVLWFRDHDRFRRFVPLFVGLTAIGYLTYVLYPAMPPWMVSANGSMAPTARIIPIIWDHVGVHQAAALFEGNAAFDNDVAAVPSLHAAYPMLICLFFWGRAKPWLRVLLVAYVVAMATTLVYTGEHFIFDIVLGWTYAIVTFVVGSKLLDRLAARKARRRAAAGTPTTPDPVEDASDGLTTVPSTAPGHDRRPVPAAASGAGT